MNRFDNMKKQQLDELLFSGGEDSHNLSQQNSYNEINECENGFIYKMQNDPGWSSNNNLDKQFLCVNGPSIQFSQNYSQNSMMLSHRQDDDSRDYKRDSNKYYKLLQQKKKEDVLYNEAFDKEITKYKQDMQKLQLEIKRLTGLNKGLQVKIDHKEAQIQQLEATILSKDDQKDKLRLSQDDLQQVMKHRQQCFSQYKRQTEELLRKITEKDKENQTLRKEVQNMGYEIEQLQQNMAYYTEHDNKLLDFGNNYGRSSSYDQKRNSITDKEVQKLKRQKNSLELDLSAIRDKLEDRQNRFKLVEEENRKKIQLKEKKIAELQQKMNEYKDDNLKMKTINQINLEKVSGNLSLKMKELAAQTQKLSQYQRRVKSLLQENRKKDERTKDLTLQMLQKTKLLNLKQKEQEELKIKLEFDHHMIEDKDQQIENLLQQHKTLKLQINSQLDKIDRNEKQEKQKNKKQSDKYKKESETLKKQNQTLKKELQSAKRQYQVNQKEQQEQNISAKDSKRKVDDITKKMTQLRNSNMQLDQQIRQKDSEIAQLHQQLDHNVKELKQFKKQHQTVSQLKNKIILLESRLKTEPECRDMNDSFEISTLHDRIEALEQRLEERDKQNKSLKAQLRTGHCSEQEVQELALQLGDRDQIIENLECQLDKLRQLYDNLRQQYDTLRLQYDRLQEQSCKLAQDLKFKDNTLQFTHKVLVNCEKAKIELEQEKKFLEQMIQNQQHSIDEDGQREQMVQFYQHKLAQQQNQSNFTIKQLKDRNRQLMDKVINKDKKITPETMSQQDTVSFLVKTLRKVNKSAEMLKMLSRNQDFRQSLICMERQFNKK